MTDTAMKSTNKSVLIEFVNQRIAFHRGCDGNDQPTCSKCGINNALTSAPRACLEVHYEPYHPNSRPNDGSDSSFEPYCSLHLETCYPWGPRDFETVNIRFYREHEDHPNRSDSEGGGIRSLEQRKRRMQEDFKSLVELVSCTNLKWIAFKYVEEEGEEENDVKHRLSLSASTIGQILGTGLSKLPMLQILDLSMTQMTLSKASVIRMILITSQSLEQLILTRAKFGYDDNNNNEGDVDNDHVDDENEQGPRRRRAAIARELANGLRKCASSKFRVLDLSNCPTRRRKCCGIGNRYRTRLFY